MTEPYLPVNPCEGCSFDPKSHDFKGECSSRILKDSCYAYERYQSNLAALETYTQHLIENEAMGVSIEDNEDEEIMMVEVETLESMLAKIREAKG
jgi:hypothetical protein